MENREEIKRFLELIANSVGATITEYHWREACGLIKSLEEEPTENEVILRDYPEQDKPIVSVKKNRCGGGGKKSSGVLDCPFDFTSRCTMGRCDCKPKY